MTDWRKRHNRKFSRAAEICKKWGMKETADSVAAYCRETDDEVLCLISSRELAEEIAGYCGVNTL